MKYSSFISKINSITHLNNKLKRTIAINVVLCPDIHCLTLQRYLFWIVSYYVNKTILNMNIFG